MKMGKNKNIIKIENDHKKRNRLSRYLGVFGMICFLWAIIPGQLEASGNYFDNPEHIYEAFLEDIYNPEYEVKYGFSAEEAPVFRDWRGTEVVGTLEKFGGVIVTSETESYAQVIYEMEELYYIGWIEQSFYQEEVKFYDGSEKQLLADGIYKMESHNGDRSYYVELQFEKNQTYAIRSIITDTYLEVSYNKNDKVNGLFWNEKNESHAQNWKLIRAYDRFYVWNEDANMYLVPRDEKALGLTPIIEPLGNRFDKGGVKEAYRTATWEFSLQFNKNVDPYRNFLQYDSDWSKEEYGNVEGDYGGRMAAAGCGVVSITNMVYALTGEFIDPMMLADFAVEHGYRMIGYGTQDDIYEAAAIEFGEAYHFQFVKRCYDVFEMRDYLKEGCAVISHVPGHYLAVADYDEAKEEYLVLDSHPIPKRPTTPWGDWFPWQRLESGGLRSSCYFIFERR